MPIGFKQQEEQKEAKKPGVETKKVVALKTDVLIADYVGSSKDDTTFAHETLIMEVRSLSAMILSDGTIEQRKVLLESLITKVALEAELSTLKRN